MGTSTQALEELEREMGRENREIEKKKIAKQAKEKELTKKKWEMEKVEAEVGVIQSEINQLEQRRLQNKIKLESIQRELERLSKK